MTFKTNKQRKAFFAKRKVKRKIVTKADIEKGINRTGFQSVTLGEHRISQIKPFFIEAQNLLKDLLNGDEVYISDIRALARKSLKNKEMTQKEFFKFSEELDNYESY